MKTNFSPGLLFPCSLIHLDIAQMHIGELQEINAHNTIVSKSLLLLMAE